MTNMNRTPSFSAKCLVAFLLAACVLPLAIPTAGAAAFSSEQRAALEKIAAYVRGITTLQGKFVQTGPDGRQVNGYFVLERPGKLLFRYNKPVPLEIVADGKAVVIRDRKLKTQDLYPLSKTPLRFLLSDKIDLARDTRVLEIVPQAERLEMVVEEETPFGTGRIALVFDPQSYELKAWTIIDGHGRKTTFALYEVESGKPTDPKWFWIDHINRGTAGDR